MKKYAFLIVVYVIVMCSCQRKGTEKNIEESQSLPFVLDFEFIKNERFYDILDDEYLVGAAKTLKCWSTDIETPSEKELFAEITYNAMGMIIRNLSYAHGDQNGDEYNYDDSGRLSSRHQILDNKIVYDQQWKYKYFSEYQDGGGVRREVYQNNVLQKTEIETRNNNTIYFDINYSTNQKSEKYSLKFVNNHISDFVKQYGTTTKYLTNFQYNDVGLLTKIIEYTAKGKERTVTEYFYDQNNRIQEAMTYDYLEDPVVISRIQKVVRIDNNGNWLSKEIYQNEIMVARIDREIEYW